MRADSFRALGFALLAVLALASFWAVLPRLLETAGGAEIEVAAALKKTEPEGLEMIVPGFNTPLRSTRHDFSRVSLRLLNGGREVEVTATLDFTGKLGGLQVSSLGLERLTLHSQDGKWRPVHSWAPSLVTALAALESRRRALEAGDVPALSRIVPDSVRSSALSDPALHTLLRVKGRRYQVQGWYLRFERGEVQVTEEGRLQGDSPDRPIDDHLLRRLHLVAEGREFLFSPSLM